MSEEKNVPAANSITAYFHCRECLEMWKSGEATEETGRPVSMSEWARLEAGFTRLGIQVRCVRHDLNILHVDFEGQQHPANLKGRDLDG